MIHLINMIIHVTAGVLALIVGLLALILHQNRVQHSRFGRYFLLLLAVVVATGFIGWLFFRSDSFLILLTFLSGYVGYSGLRTVRRKEQRANATDAIIAIIVLLTGIGYIIWLRNSSEHWSPNVIYSTLAALVFVTVYDLIKVMWLHTLLKKLWLSEHIYKMISAFSAILSAFCGTVLPDSFKPYSQIGPSGFSILLIVFFIIRSHISRLPAAS